MHENIAKDLPAITSDLKSLQGRATQTGTSSMYQKTYILLMSLSKNPESWNLVLVSY